MRERATVLVTAAGTIVAQGIIKSFKFANSREGTPTEYRIITTDMSALAAGLYRGDEGFIVPAALSEDYVDTIIHVIKATGARAVFVGADEELSVLARSADSIRKETGACVVTDSLENIEIGQDKWRTFQSLKMNNLPCAQSALPEDQSDFVREFGYPIIVKPREGHGSRHMYLVKDQGELERATRLIRGEGWSPLLQEYLKEEDAEFTSGITIDREGRSVMSSISMRRSLKGGQTFKAFVDDFSEVRRAAEDAALKTGRRGPVNVQARLDRDVPKTFEINPRFSASCPMRTVAGVNEPDIVFRNWVLDERMSVKEYRKLVCLRFYDEVYVPLDGYRRAQSDGRVEGGQGSFVVDYF